MERTAPEPEPEPGDEATGRRTPITVVTPTWNEAHQIGQVIEGLDWADEVIVVDGGSEDGTAAIAGEHGARVICTSPELTVGGYRNVGIAAARNEWVLALDADERPTPELVAELRALLAAGGPAPAHDAYRVRLRSFCLGRELRRGSWARDWHVRLFRRRYRFRDLYVLEGPASRGSVGALHGTIVHHPYRDLAHQLRQTIADAQRGAEALRRRGAHATLWQLTAYPARRFVRDYLGHGFVRDGRFGLLVSALSAITVFLEYAFLLAAELVQRGK